MFQNRHLQDCWPCAFLEVSVSPATALLFAEVSTKGEMWYQWCLHAIKLILVNSALTFVNQPAQAAMAVLRSWNDTSRRRCLGDPQSSDGETSMVGTFGLVLLIYDQRRILDSSLDWAVVSFLEWFISRMLLSEFRSWNICDCFLVIDLVCLVC